jgi:2-polyprenyl-6-hydroxyphenyl methylase/3-demethylubiquinone-9 3-methyltransferase
MSAEHAASLDAPSVDAPSVDAGEIDKFSRMAEEWWNPNGKFRPLHRFNPTRLQFIREVALAHFGRDTKSLSPFGGLALLDIGCGGGLLCEPMSRLGFDVLGVDASEKNIGIAEAHATAAGVNVRYRAATAEALAEEGALFDVVLNMEVVEHVADVPGFLKACANVVAPGGVMIVATLNRTMKSLALAKVAAEYVLGWLPVGAHDWSRFITPFELKTNVEDAGLEVTRLQGVSFDILNWDWKLSDDTDVNYIIVGEKRA